jgi:RNA polymerase primary sigma factor
MSGGSWKNWSLSRYLAESRKHPLLTAAQEIALARTVAARRYDLWATLVSWPPLERSILRSATEMLRVPAADPDALVARIAERDRDQRVASCVVRDLDAIARGEARRAHGPNIHRQHSGFADFYRRVGCARRRLTAARNRMACANLRLVAMIAKRVGGTLPIEDRMQEGNLGLLMAVDRFDPDRGFRFSTYAVWWIRHAMVRAEVERADLVRVPAHHHVLFRKAARVVGELSTGLGRPPSSTEVAGVVGEPAHLIERARLSMSARTPASLAVADETVASSVLAADLEVDQALDGPRNLARARAVLLHLPAKQREILRRRFGLDGEAPASLNAIGASLGISRERVRQLQNSALAQLRAELDAGPPPP